MAEGLINHLLGEQWVAVSAGTQPAGYVHPLAIKALAELGIDIAGNRSKTVEQFRRQTFDLVITVCDEAAEQCPLWLGQGVVVHIGFIDPAKATGSEAEQMAVFRQVRNEIQARLLSYVAARG